jgi:hypothetical protein
MIELTRSGATSENTQLEGELIWRDPQVCDRLMRSLYSVDWHREFMHRNALFATPLEVLGRLLTFRWPFSLELPTWSPALFRDRTSGGPALAVIAPDKNRRHAALLAFQALNPGKVITVTVLGPDTIEIWRTRIAGPEQQRSLASKGLDGAIVRRFRATLEGEEIDSPAILAEAAE